MKKFLVAIPVAALFLASCGGGSNDHALEEILDTMEEFDAATNSFADGNASDGEQYFFGVQAEVIEIDVKMAEIEELDIMDAPEEEINAMIDSAFASMASARKAMALYESKNWALKDELNELTHEWFDGVVDLLNDYLKDLAEPLSRPEDTWTDEEFELYEEFYYAREDFYAGIDTEWVEFQYEYGDAHGIVFGDESIDVDALVEQDMAANESN
ncbi:MAG: hypothetical protein QNK23_07265 [Crocinitomicaceae bacterium]|nr:hypothetical protein [Crocinitomicaceae bacterium]